MSNSSPYQSLQSVREHRFFMDVMKPVLVVNYFFGQSLLSNTLGMLFLAKFLFVTILAYIVMIFAFAVFKRGAAIDVWIQLSLYIIPLLGFIVGAYIIGSSAYHRLVQRKITRSVSVRFYLDNQDWDTHAPGHNKDWLKAIAIKSLLFPFLLQFLQWGAFGVFYMFDNDRDFIKDFVGSVTFLPGDLWTALYIINWILTVYIIGFITYQFVFVSRLIVKDTVHLMSLFGKTSYLQIYPVYNFSWNNHCLLKFFSGIINFISMDLFNAYFDERIYTHCADIARGDENSVPNFLPSRVLHSPFRPGGDHSHSSAERLEEPESEYSCQMTPAEACELFSIFIAEAEALTSIFVPFNILITFFGIANLITHVGVFIRSPEGGIHSTYWTLFRTFLFLLVVLRIIFSVQRVTSVLGKLPPHINLIKTAGKLGYQDHQRPNWNDFVELVASFNLGKRAFGFPMTLRQIASFVTVINMAFLIVFSIYNNKSKDKF